MKPLLSLLLLAYPMAAGEQGVNCSGPVVFPNAEVNVVVLPYDYLGANAVLERSASAQRLSLLLQRNILFSLLKYPSIGSVQLVRRGTEPCEPGIVADQLLKKRSGSPRPLGPQKTAVMLWGNFYEEGDALYVRSFLRLVRNYPEGEQLAMKVGDASFTGAMPVKTVAFPATRITAAELRQIDAQFRGLNKIRSEPDDSAPAREIPLDPATPFSYSIARVQGEWMYVQPMVSGPAGWVKAGAHLSDLPLRKKMPELSFLDGVVAYVFAAGAGPQTPASARWTAQAMDAMNRFAADA
ncbi:MAG TPA: hypothetical protein VMZ52_13280, partial [Bryobacteraceae bacterium]|nr:hypothetical protein [Bryobacteraceae bacterium]